MSKYVIDLDSERCIACGACVVACMDQNDIDPDSAQDLLRKVAVVERGHSSEAELMYLTMSCMHCSDAPCIKACPSGCFTKDPETGFTLYDDTNCIGCRSCSMACPFSAPTTNRDGKIIKCDGCNTRVKNGLEPSCVRVCPFDALTLVDEEAASEKRAANSIAAVADIIRKSKK